MARPPVPLTPKNDNVTFGKGTSGNVVNATIGPGATLNNGDKLRRQRHRHAQHL